MIWRGWSGPLCAVWRANPTPWGWWGVLELFIPLGLKIVSNSTPGGFSRKAGGAGLVFKER